jgi:oxygen-dependent protoporphyrinogen oxidase
VGHVERLARIDAQRGAWQGLHLLGNAYRGVGVNDCVREGRVLAQALSI